MMDQSQRFTRKSFDQHRIIPYSHIDKAFIDEAEPKNLAVANRLIAEKLRGTYPRRRTRHRMTLLDHRTIFRPERTRFFLKLITAIETILLLSLCTDIFAQSETIRVLYYPPWNISKLPMYLARDAELFERAGLSVTWI